MSNDTRGESVSSLDGTIGDLPRDQEYETQYLGFAPRSFCDGVYNAVLDYTWEYFRASQEYMKYEYGHIISEEELQNGAEVFLSSVTQKIDEKFDKFESYTFTNTMHIPDDVVLPEDKVQEDYRNFSPEEERSLDDDICKLKKRIIAAKYVNASLRREYKQLRQVRDEYDKFLVLLHKLTRSFKEARVLDVRESLTFAASEATMLVRLINQMHEAATLEKNIMDASELDTMLKHLESATKQQVVCSNTCAESALLS